MLDKYRLDKYKAVVIYSVIGDRVIRMRGLEEDGDLLMLAVDPYVSIIEVLPIEIFKKCERV